ncbi:hypothetical protein R1flu_027083 [Riccia fluitans]|uniref:Methyltransferase n=1 Tax=Riccia fluitans TaxID=41844 RepID=A0ABD1XHS2_9MARC
MAANYQMHRLLNGVTLLTWHGLRMSREADAPRERRREGREERKRVPFCFALAFLDELAGGMGTFRQQNQGARRMGKPSSPKLQASLEFRKVKATWVLGTALLCATFYFLGEWQGSSDPAASLAEVKPSSESGCSPSLDFSTHHGSADGISTALKTFEPCEAKYSEYTPCEDTLLSKRSLNFPRDRLVYRERHCPAKEELLKCLIPAPPKYTTPLSWPTSLEYSWYVNVPHKELTVEKAIQNWIVYEGDKFHFPGGGTMFPKGAGQYINNIDDLINLQDGHVRTALDTGCGVASWGGYLNKRDILAMSFAPRDSHEAQVQFALERGIPAMIAVMATKRLPYPARAFDMAHCSRCLIPWADYNGTNLIEVDRVLRPGGYWILSGPPVNWKSHYKGWNRTEEDLKAEQDKIEDLATRLCWTKVHEKGDLAIWQKPLNHNECKQLKRRYPLPHICTGENPDTAWYRDTETCITSLPDVEDNEVAGGGPVAKWPQRLKAVPPRILSGSLLGVTEEKYNEDTELWISRLDHYKKMIPPLGHGKYRNMMDMNAGLGGFAAALGFDPVWVMNTVPPDAAINTLGVVYERGLIGSYQDWCEAFSTYPRTYDLVHASGIFSMYQDRCELDDILLEMDRIVRPEGVFIIRDDVDVLNKVNRLVRGMRYETKMYDHEDGPLVKEKILLAKKIYWTAEELSDSTPDPGR